MGKTVYFYRQKSNQPRNANVNLEEQMLQRNYKCNSELDSDRIYMRYIKTLIRVQNAIHRRSHQRIPRNLQTPIIRIAAGGSYKDCKDSDKAQEQLKKCHDQHNELPCDAAKPWETGVPSNDKPVESPCQYNKTSQKNVDKRCNLKPEPTKSPCHDAHENQQRSCVCFQEPVARDIPDCDPSFRDYPCSESDEPTSTTVCCDEKHPRKKRITCHCCTRPVIV
uniref:Uncharacterized protein LOC108043710 n=1 Tax=Drosophila rhopaloa TaxID=1041015 RepID=A0A6P4ESG4_DRORH